MFQMAVSPICRTRGREEQAVYGLPRSEPYFAGGDLSKWANRRYSVAERADAAAGDAEKADAEVVGAGS